MPWRQTSPMNQRTQFIADFLRQTLSITELCDLYGVSRKTAYKWIDRYLRTGPAGLCEQSRRPHCSPNQTPEEIVAVILDARRRHPSWGAKKLLRLLHNSHPRNLVLTPFLDGHYPFLRFILLRTLLKIFAYFLKPILF